MIVVRELLLGHKRFTDLQRDVIGIGPTILTRRLGELITAGVATKTEIDGLRGGLYELTPWGYRLEGVNTALAEWAVASPALPWGADMSPDTLILTMRAHAEPRPDLVTQPATVALRLTDSRQATAGDPVHYLASLSPTQTTIDRTDSPSEPTATLITDTRALKAVVLGQIEYAASTPGITTMGDPVAAQWLIAATRLAAHV